MTPLMAAPKTAGLSCGLGSSSSKANKLSVGLREAKKWPPPLSFSRVEPRRGLSESGIQRALEETPNLGFSSLISMDTCFRRYDNKDLCMVDVPHKIGTGPNGTDIAFWRKYGTSALQYYYGPPNLSGMLQNLCFAQILLKLQDVF